MRICRTALSVLVICLAAPVAVIGDELARGFQSPPDSAKPWTYWWWLNGHVSRDGITQDLEAMKRQGINGVLIFNAGGGETPPGLKFLGPEWRAMYKHALREAGRLGMEVSVNLCDGWDCGGPWITPECANKKLVYSEMQAEGRPQTSEVSKTSEVSGKGPRKVVLKLPQPPTLDGFYRDVAVVAFRDHPTSPVAPLHVTANSEVGGYCDEKNWPAADAVDRDPQTVWRSGPAPSGEGRRLLMEYAQPLRASAVMLIAPRLQEPRPCRLEASASDDGKQFRTVAEFSLCAPSQRIALSETTSRWFRLSIADVTRRTGIEESSWIWYPEGNPAVMAPPGAVHLRRSLALPAGCRIASASFTATADNSFTLHVNGQRAGGNVNDPAGFHRLTAIDVAKLLRPGDNLLAVTAENAATEPNPAGFIGRLAVVLADGQRVDLVTDDRWRASRRPDEGWQNVGFDDRAWPAAMKVAPHGSGPWGKPAAADADFELAEVWLLRAGDEPHMRLGTKWWHFKSANRSFWDWPKQGPGVLQDEYTGPDVCDVGSSEVVDLSSHMRPDGTLDWQAPPGRWTILRFGYTLQGQRTRSGSTVAGYEADMLSAAGIECHFKNLAEPLLADAGDAVGRTLKFLHVDSYELGADIQGQQPTWSADFRREFKARRGYDLLRYLPAMARRVVDGREPTGRFFWDFRATIGDLMAEKFFARFGQLARARGVGMHCETGYGTYPHPHFDGLRCAGLCDVTMGEFWHGTNIMSQFDPFCNVIRSVASAAHVYGRRIVQAEAFTSWNHFVEYPFALKALGDEAFCDGLNRMVFHQYTHQPQSDVIPGWQYGAGTHIDRHITWWPMAGAWFNYLARCQYMLQSGRFHADVCYFYGEGSTKYVPGRAHVRPSLPSGYDFDCVNADVLQNRLSVKDGRVVLPGEASYRVLVLPEERTTSPRILRRIGELIEAGAIICGPRPLRAPGLGDYPKCDEEVRALADRLWGPAAPEQGERRIGKGRLIWGRPLATVLAELGVPPDFETRSALPGSNLRFIHRTIDGANVYFVSNQRAVAERVECAFRVGGLAPELWDPVSGTVLRLENCRVESGRTLVPIQFAPSQSFFVVFRERKPEPDTAAVSCDQAFPSVKPAAELTGPWEVSFDPKWGGPSRVVFDKLVDWTKHSDEQIRHYSGTATYRRSFDLPVSPGDAASPRRTYLDLGTVHHLARVRLNGKDLGVVWCAPWRVDITEAVRATGNRLEIDVVNLWPNRLIGDAGLPPAKRLTRTNVAFSKDQPLLPSGLIGPVTIQGERPRPR